MLTNSDGTFFPDTGSIGHPGDVAISQNAYVWTTVNCTLAWSGSDSVSLARRTWPDESHTETSHRVAVENLRV